ncbi:MAG: hypothetical protein QOK35_604 [Pseudonocardiales bacterium]|jgi:hypothetical protein|nr:hypothetical protein [Pseudonocardiales bacterium]
MLGSPLLGTAVGLVLLFATTALLCSGITEWLSNRLQLRAKYLLTGMRAMLDAPEEAERSWKERTGTLNDRVKKKTETEQAVLDLRGRMSRTSPPPGPLPPPGLPATPGTTAPAPTAPVTTALWDSPLLTSLQSRRVGVLRKGALRNPQYVSGRTFARALVDLLVSTDPDGTPPVVLRIEKIRVAVDSLPAELPLRRPLLSFLARAGGDVEVFERAVEQWYDEQMAKIGGWYKRWSRVILGVVGFLVAAAVNIDTVQVAHSLYVDAPLQQAVVATADAGALCRDVTDPQARTTCATTQLETLRAAGLPVGYSAGCDPAAWTWGPCWRWSDQDTPSGWDFPRKLLGWLVTAFAVSFGAPFWFEALSKLGSLRNAGTKPSSSTAS